MAENAPVLTREGKAKLEEELAWREGDKRNEISERIKEAKSFGDLSENSEYDDAKNEQGWNESRIIEIRYTLDHAHVVDTPRRASKVDIGTHVSITVKPGGKKMEYDIVGSAEADATAGKISNESPIGSALLGHKKGDVVEVTTPAGTKKLEITDIAPIK
ncbi:MAG: transcription elongation factor GreA [Actinomycetes bacterium]|jgi:transcription elongation factor GreA|nr:transcription elongation factor GreA [Actinomycetes bacterium]